MVYAPWSTRSCDTDALGATQGCSLVALLEAMQSSFAQLPPVYSKPARAATQSAAPSRPPAGPDYTSRPPPPVPGTHAPTPSQTVSPSPIPAVSNDALPPLPAKPGTPAISPALASISRTPSLQSPAPAHAHNSALGILGNVGQSPCHCMPYSYPARLFRSQFRCEAGPWHAPSAPYTPAFPDVIRRSSGQ